MWFLLNILKPNVAICDWICAEGSHISWCMQWFNYELCHLVKTIFAKFSAYNNMCILIATEVLSIFPDIEHRTIKKWMNNCHWHLLLNICFVELFNLMWPWPTHSKVTYFYYSKATTQNITVTWVSNSSDNVKYLYCTTRNVKYHSSKYINTCQQFSTTKAMLMDRTTNT